MLAPMQLLSHPRLIPRRPGEAVPTGVPQVVHWRGKTYDARQRHLRGAWIRNRTRSKAKGQMTAMMV